MLSRPGNLVLTRLFRSRSSSVACTQICFPAEHRTGPTAPLGWIPDVSRRKSPCRDCRLGLCSVCRRESRLKCLACKYRYMGCRKQRESLSRKVRRLSRKHRKRPCGCCSRGWHSHRNRKALRTDGTPDNRKRDTRCTADSSSLCRCTRSLPPPLPSRTRQDSRPCNWIAPCRSTSLPELRKSRCRPASLPESCK